MSFIRDLRVSVPFLVSTTVLQKQPIFLLVGVSPPSHDIIAFYPPWLEAQHLYELYELSVLRGSSDLWCLDLTSLFISENTLRVR